MRPLDFAFGLDVLTGAPPIIWPHDEELTIDSFAGGGGVSTGCEMAIGRAPDVAINHDVAALIMHAVNHPGTIHLPHNVWKAAPLAVTGGRPVGLFWLSPDCKDFSKAKGGVPKRKNIRDLAWVAVRWAQEVAPRVIILENVEEFRQWGPLWLDPATGHLVPDPQRRGETFRAFVRALRRLGYRVQWRELRACDYGAPTIRKRLFIVMRRDGEPIVWPKPTHGDPKSAAVRKGRLKPWVSAAEIIDFSIPCPSIFLTREEAKAAGCRRPLAPATMARIAKGVERHVLMEPKPFMVVCNHAGEGFHGHAIHEPFRTVTATRDAYGVVMPFLVPRYGERLGQEPRSRSVDRPAPVIVPTGNEGRLAAVFLAQHNTDMIGHDARKPVSTIVGKGCTQAVVSLPVVAKYYSEGGSSQGVGEPLHTDTTKPRFGLIDAVGVRPPLSEAQAARARQVADFLRAHGVAVDGEFATVGDFIIVDIGMRILTPRERFNAQGFPPGYVIDPEVNGKPLTVEAQGRMCGNSVPPPLAAAVIAANYRPRKISAEPPPPTAPTLFDLMERRGA